MAMIRRLFCYVGMMLLCVPQICAAQRAVTLNYGLSQFLVSTAPLFSVPLQMGFWKQEGLDVSLEGANGGSAAIQQLATRQVQMTITGVPSLMQLKEKGAPVIAVGSAYTVNPFFPAVLATSPIHSIQDFKGKTVAVTSLTVSHIYWLRAMLVHAGLKADDVTFVPVGGAGGPVLYAMRTGQVDIFEAFDAAYAELEVNGAVLRRFDNLDYLKQLAFVQGIYVNEATVKSDPDLIVKLLRGIAKGIVFSKENPEVAIRLHWKEFPTSKPIGVDDAKAMQDSLHVLDAQLRSLDADASFGRVTREQVEAVRDVLFDNQAIEKKLPADAYYTDQFLTRANDFDRDAVRKAARDFKSN